MIRFGGASAQDAPFFDYALDLASGFLGLELLRAEPADLRYGEHIPRVERYGAEDVPGLPADEPPGEVFPFDFFAALRFWLADEGNLALGDDAWDPHQRIHPWRSVQHVRGLREVPIVNAYLALFGAWLEAHRGARVRSPLPDGKRCVVVLSHDVDDPLDPTPMRTLSHLALAARRLDPRAVVGLARTFAGQLREPGGRHWLFHEVLEAEARHGFRSTFFFAAKNMRERDASHLDVDYDVRDPRFRPVFEDIAAHGAEVGLHVSIRGHEGAERIAAERERIEEASGATVRGSRHHHWNLGRPATRTLALHAPAGLSWDASIGFNAAPGLRLGIAWPFRPWNPETGEAIPTLQIPTFAMDAALFRDPETGVERALGVEAATVRFGELLDRLKAHRGVASIDWHARSSFPGSTRNLWGETYLAILEMLAADSEVEVATGAEILDRARA